jgi:hypothetical protein
MRILAFVTVFGLAVASVVPLHAQSLVDVAKTESERRQAVKGGTKVYTNGDLKSVPEPAQDSTSAADPSDASAAEKKPAESKADANADEKASSKDAKAVINGDDRDQNYWHARMQALNDQLSRDRLYAEALQTRINSLTADFSSHDDPAQRALIADDREKAVSELTRLRNAIEEDKDAVGTAEDEARRANVPPGWLR